MEGIISRIERRNEEIKEGKWNGEKGETRMKREMRGNVK